MNAYRTYRYLRDRQRTAAYEALQICRRLYPWRCLPSCTQLTETLFAKPASE
jgi:hypothetical protein